MHRDDPSSFGKRLRAIRKRCGCQSPAKLKNLLGDRYSVSSILKRERGEIKLDRAYLDDFCAALKIPPIERKKLIAVLDVFRVQFDPWKKFKEGGGKFHFEYWERVRSVDTYRQFEPLYVCAFLQTEEYSYEAIRALGVDHATALESSRIRWAMGQELLETGQVTTHRPIQKPKKLPNLVFIQDEEAFHRVVGSAQVMLDQVRYIKDLKLPERVALRILPRHVKVAAPLGYNFNMYDDLLASMETACGNVFVTDPDTIELLKNFFSRLHDASIPAQRAQEIFSTAIRFYS